MANKYPLTSITVIGNKKVFFDANVLIYIFWPSGAYSWERSYSSAFRSLLRQRNEMLVDFIVISEIVNRAHRLEYEKYLAEKELSRSQLTYKRYRDNADGQAALADIYLIIKTNILSTFSVVGKAFNNLDILSLLTVDSLDFSDKAILMTCRDNSYVLITNDSDYKDADIDILSSNPVILGQN